MTHRTGFILATLATLALSSAASAATRAPDLTTRITAPTGVHVYESARYSVTVSNQGNTTANPASVVIQLPTTRTSPTVYVMGTLGAKSASCTQSGTRLTCALGSIRNGTTKSVYFDLAMPESIAPLVITATASAPGELSTGNNSASHTASLDNYAIAVSAPVTLLNRHCTGQNLASFYECTLFPSSIAEHTTVLNPDGSVSFPGAPASYSGVWSSSSPEHLAFTYYEDGQPVADFDGYGVDSRCWEGITTFPNSAYSSMYRVCKP